MKAPDPKYVTAMSPDKHLALFMQYMREGSIPADCWEGMSWHQQEYFKEIKRWHARNNK